MAGYKGHLVGGLMAYGITLYVVRLYCQPTPLMQLEWLVLALIGALFPDIDVKSKGQKLSYLLIGLLCVWLLLNGYYQAVTILALMALLPMMVRHRGIFHNIWFVLVLAAATVVICSRYTPITCYMACMDALFFMVGVISHLWLDRGWRRLLKIR